PLCRQYEYKGRRVKRGLFRSHEGILINADCNGSGNIIKKVVPNAFVEGIQGSHCVAEVPSVIASGVVVVHPVKITPHC
ncbi:MAG: hypothetical protein AAFV71_29930, partial [Cyanobacteria bacterium J06633_8]